MSPRVRAAATAVLVSLLATATVALADNGKSAMALLPKDSGGVVTVNVKKLRKSPHFARIVEYFRTQGELGKKLDQIGKDTGFDFEKQVSTLVIGLPLDMEAQKDDAVMVIEGKFDPKSAVKAMATANTEKPYTLHKIGSVTYWENGETFVAIVGKRLVITKTLARLKASIDASKSKPKSVLASSDVQDLVKATDTAKDIWMAIRLDGMASVSAAAPDVKAFTASADLASSGAGLAMALVTATTEGASSLAQQVEMILSMGGSDENLAPLLKKISVEATGTQVLMDAQLSAEDVAKLASLASVMGGGAL